jgi:hypothetical protein
MTRIFRLFVVALRTWAPNFLLHTILRRGVDFAFDLDALTKIDEQADFNAGGFQVIGELGLVCGVKVFDGFQFEDDLVFHDDVGHVVADQLVVVIDLDLLFLFGAESGFQELDQEGILIDDFKEAEAEGVVNLVGTLDDCGGEVLVFHSFGTDFTGDTVFSPFCCCTKNLGTQFLTAHNPSEGYWD